MRPQNQNIETENTADEADIIADQDETLQTSPQETDPNLGAGGTEEIGADREEFTRGEIDVKEAMDRAVREMNYANPASQRKSKPTPS